MHARVVTPALLSFVLVLSPSCGDPADIELGGAEEHDSVTGMAASAALVYVPVTPCRIADTRRTAAGLITASTERTFRAFGPSGVIGAQGGNTAGCPKPSGGQPVAAHINMVAIDPTGKGNLKAFGSGSGSGAGLSVNFNAIDTNLANAGTVTMTNGSFAIASSYASAHASVQVLGYYYPSDGLSYVPVAPCRIADTRKTSPGIIAAGTQRTFKVFGSGATMASQGGSTAGCPKPQSGQPLAAHINLVAVNPTQKGNLTAFPSGATSGAGLSVNYNNIGTNLANAGTIKTRGADITVASNHGSAHATIQVLGYYYPTGGLSYVAVKPCRIADTRQVGGVLGAGSQRIFRVFGSAETMHAQGGNSAGCNKPLPGQPMAAHINMVAVGATGQGNIKAFPPGADPDSGLSVNYGAIDTNLANAGTMKTVSGNIAVASGHASTHAAIQVLGYYYRTEDVAPSPNIVVFFVDDMGWTDWQVHPDLNPTGSIVYETPSLHRLAQDGLTFTSGYSSAPVCSPTRASLQTGKTTARTRITQYITEHEAFQANLQSATLKPPQWLKNLPASEITIAEALAEAGYSTGFVGKWHLGKEGHSSADPRNHGYGINVGGAHHANPAAAGGHFAGSDGAWAGMPGIDKPGTFPPKTYLADVLAGAAEDFIQSSHEDGGPFFLLLSHHVPHAPIQAPAHLVDKYTAKINSLRAQGKNLNGHESPTYAGMIQKMDESLGRVLDRLEDPNGDGDHTDSIRDDTIIIFASDNGGLLRVSDDKDYGTANPPLRVGKGSMYEGGIRVPFFVSWTGNDAVPTGTLTTARTSTHDIYPTLLELAGVAGDHKHNAAMDGVSIADAIEGKSFQRNYQYWHYPHMSPQDLNAFVVGGRFVSAVRRGPWKLLYYYDDKHFELYQTDDDIGETNDLLGTSALAQSIAHELSEALHDHLAAVRAQTPIEKSSNRAVGLPRILAQP